MGGGPAGSSVAGILAREGRQVILFEKEIFPRHHIGESLMTDTYWTFRRLGLLEKLKESPFVRKYSVQFANSAGKESRPFYFFEAVHHESAVTWQVTRAQFDHMLIDHAAEQGAVVHQGVLVKQVLFEGDQAVGVEVQMQDGTREKFYAKVVVDATGQTCDALEQVSLARARSETQKGRALFLFQRRASRAGSERWRDARAAHGTGQWRLVLVYPARKRHHECRHRCQSRLPLEEPRPGPGEDLSTKRLRSVNRAGGVSARALASIRSIRFSTTRIVPNTTPVTDLFIIGDAYGFLDPIYSSGVLLALKMAELAADAIHDAFNHDDFSAERLGQYQAKLDRGIESMRKLVYAFYNDGFSFAGFCASILTSAYTSSIF